MSKPLTARQKEYLECIRKFFAENDQLPPILVLARAMGVTNTSAQGVVERLVDAGELQYNSVGRVMFARGEK
jgi:Mn-dependent DtxR family transcriptional regulator